jgi:F420-non-reducing hydrogenase small subunit
MEGVIEDKLKLALYGTAVCGGCEVAVLDLNERTLDLAAAADITMPQTTRGLSDA